MGAETERAHERNACTRVLVKRRIAELELADPIAAVEKHKRESEVELGKVRDGLSEEVAAASETSKRTLDEARTELSKVKLTVQEFMADMASPKEATSEELESVRLKIVKVAEEAAQLTDSVRKTNERTDAELGATKTKLFELEGALEALPPNLAEEMGSFKAQLAGIQGLQREGADISNNFERLRESVEALQSVSDETNERLAETEETLEVNGLSQRVTRGSGQKWRRF
jgi:chromosome segregation ATPase